MARPKLKIARIIFDKSEYNYSTSVNGMLSDDEIKHYFLNQVFNLGSVEDDLQLCMDCIVEDDMIISEGDSFSFAHPDYPNSSLKGKTLIAGTVTDEYVERYEKGSLVCRKYPIKYCTKVL